MMQHRGLGTMFVVAALACSALAFAEAPKGKPAAANPAGRASKVARGAYLVGIMGCNDCHTPGTFYGAPDMERQLSGSEIPWKGPWGYSFARNLTPDPETGIGYYSENEIVNTLRTGVKPSGGVMLPPMPWQNLVHLTDDDAHAIAAYLMSLKPVKHEVPEALPPGAAWTGGPAVEFPPPPAWDAPRTPPAGK